MLSTISGSKNQTLGLPTSLGKKGKGDLPTPLNPLEKAISINPRIIPALSSGYMFRLKVSHLQALTTFSV